MFVLDGRRGRKIRTTIGVVDLPNLTRVKCAHCGNTYVPVIEICGLDLYQTKTAGVEKLVVEQCAQTSYRRATKAVAEMTGVCVALHVQLSAAVACARHRLSAGVVIHRTHIVTIVMRHQAAVRPHPERGNPIPNFGTLPIPWGFVKIPALPSSNGSAENFSFGARLVSIRQLFSVVEL